MRDFEPGIYFGLSEEAYHADPALSNSGISHLLISPLDFWTHSPMNPDFEDKKTDAMIVGTAFHRRLLEPERFESMYAALPSRDEYPDAIDGGEALKAECERLELKKSGRISELCDRILEAYPEAQLWPVINERLLDEREGMTLLPRAKLDNIERTAEIVLAHQSAAKAITGGVAEVSIFWIDEESGVRMKARIDYLKIKAIVDVKTFNNALRRPVDVAIAMAVANHRYDVKVAVYGDAVEAAKMMLRRDKTKAIHFENGAEVENDWIAALAACETHSVVFVFIEQGAVSNVRVREFCRSEALGGTVNLYWGSARDGFREGVRIYADFMKRFGPEQPWIDDQPMRPFVDQDFPLWMFN